MNQETLKASKMFENSQRDGREKVIETGRGETRGRQDQRLVLTKSRVRNVRVVKHPCGWMGMLDHLSSSAYHDRF